MPLLQKPNSWVTRETTDTSPLYCALQVDPAPLTVSVSAADPTLVSLQFVVTNFTNAAVAVEYIDFTLEVGTGTAITPTTDNIKVTLSDTTNWTVVQPGVITSGTATYRLKPSTGSSYSLPAYASVAMQLYQVQTVTTPGTSTIIVKESIQGSTPPIFFTNFQVTTFPAGFFFDGLTASVPSGTDLIPVAQVNTGTQVTLTWNASVSDIHAFKIYYTSPDGQKTAPPPALNGLGEWISPALTCDTVFTVVATVAAPGGQSLTAALSTGVSVQNPTLVATSLRTGQATVTGATTLANTSVGGTLGVTGATTLANTSVGGTLGVTGNTSVAGTLGVSGTATLATTNAGYLSASSANISGNLSANGSTTLNATTISGLLQANGAVGMMKSSMTLGTGTYAAPTDGIVTGWVGGPGDNGAKCKTIINGYTGPIKVEASGGNCTNLVWNEDSRINWWQGGFGNSFTLPVSKGSGFSLTVFNDSGNTKNAPTSFWWTPIGVGNVSLPERIGDAEVPADAMHLDATASTPQAQDVHDPSIRHLMNELADILGESMNASQRERLHKAIKDLVYLEGHKSQ